MEMQGKQLHSPVHSLDHPAHLDNPDLPAQPDHLYGNGLGAEKLSIIVSNSPPKYCRERQLANKKVV